MNLTTVALFGVFDGIHDGHRAFIKEAHNHGTQVVAIVARDSSVRALKGKLPLHDEAARINMLLEVPDIDLVFLGDSDEGSYKILKEVNPQVVFLGYDQQALFDSITKAIKEGVLPHIELIFGAPYEGGTLHSSLINTTHES